MGEKITQWRSPWLLFFRIYAQRWKVFLQLTNDIRTHDIYEQKDKKRYSYKEIIKGNIEKFCITNDRGAKNWIIRSVSCERDCEQETRWGTNEEDWWIPWKPCLKSVLVSSIKILFSFCTISFSSHVPSSNSDHDILKALTEDCRKF